jgi:hypothetical protein
LSYESIGVVGRDRTAVLGFADRPVATPLNLIWIVDHGILAVFTSNHRLGMPTLAVPTLARDLASEIAEWHPLMDSNHRFRVQSATSCR